MKPPEPPRDYTFVVLFVIAVIALIGYAFYASADRCDHYEPGNAADCLKKSSTACWGSSSCSFKK